ncbi:MAG: type II toxin-antitoxin system VapC family toxin [Holosporales bacterium]|jgi:PIN domain nuclease of toxin-antitoxin system
MHKGYLLDTHVFLWWLEDSPRQPEAFNRLLRTTTAPIFVSVVSLWEIRLKSVVGKLTVATDVENQVETEGFRTLSLLPAHVHCFAQLATTHPDPFDRLLWAQCLEEKLQLLTADASLQQWTGSAIVF